MTDAPEPLFVSMLDLQPRQCRWAATPDDAAPADHRFCGAKTDPGKSYCPHHDARKWGAGTRAENMAFKTARKVEA